MERTLQNTDLKGKQMRKLLEKIMNIIIGYGLSIEGEYYEDVSCHCPKETS